MTQAAPEVECIACSLMDLRSYPQHAKDGQGNCRGIFPTSWVAIDQKIACGAFAALPAPQAERRRVWWAKHQEERKWQRPVGEIATT